MRSLASGPPGFGKLSPIDTEITLSPTSAPLPGCPV
jgi:hypothetical protein